MAKNIALAGDQAPTNSDIACAGPDCVQLVKYTFDLDGRAYAEKLARLAQEQMIRKGQLPPGASAQVPEHLANISGSGELWVNGRGLPVREKVTMAIPAAPGADNRSETEMDIRFTGYKGYQEQLAAAPWLGSLAGRLARADWPSAPEAASSLGIFGMALIGAVVVARPGRRTRFAVTIAALVAIVVTPTLQASATTLAADRLSAAQASQAAEEKGRSFEQRVSDIKNSLRAAGPYAPPAAALDAVAAAQPPGGRPQRPSRRA